MSGNSKTKRRARRAQERVTEHYRRISEQPGLVEGWLHATAPGTFFGVDRSPDPVRLAGMRVGRQGGMSATLASSVEILKTLYPQRSIAETLYREMPMMQFTFKPFGPEHLTTFVSCCSDPEHADTCGLSLELALECAAWTLARRHELWIAGVEQ